MVGMAGDLRREEPDAAPLGDCPLTTFLTRTAAQNPDGIAISDQPDRAAWCGRPSRRMNYVDTVEAVSRLSFFFRSLGLPAGARVGVCLPGGSEACLTLLALESAGLTPCCLDVLTGAAELAAAIEAADIRAVVTQASVCGEPLADRLSIVAAGFFRLRFLLAFGPDVPDGVIDLDAVMSSSGAHLPRASRSGERTERAGFISFAKRGREMAPVFRAFTSLVAAALPAVAAMDAAPGDRVVSCLALDDLKGVATGLVAALVAGASFECHGLFAASTLSDVLRRGGAVHLVVPGWSEPAFASPSISGRLRSITYVHEAPLRFGPGLPSLARTVDVMAFGETALLAGERGPDGRLAISLERRGGSNPVFDLTAVSIEPSGAILVQGPGTAAETGSSRDGQTTGDGWIRSGCSVTIYGGELAGIA